MRTTTTTTYRFIEARYGDWAISYLSHEDLTRCRSRQSDVWKALAQIVGTNLDEPRTEEVHSPRALPAFLSATDDGPNVVWDAGLGTLFDQLSFTMPFDQPPAVTEAIVRRVAAVRCVVGGQAEQASQQVERAIELLKAHPIDRSYQERVDVEEQFEVFLLTEMQERFALAHELAHYLKSDDEPAFDAFAEILNGWLGQAVPHKIKPGILRTTNRVQWKEQFTALSEAALDPYAWYLHGPGTDPSAQPAWRTLASEAKAAASFLSHCAPSEREEIMCDLLAALAVAVAAHQREHGWTAVAGAACARLALANLQVILSMDAWVSSSGELPLLGSSATTRQQCLNALLPVALPYILDRLDGASHLGAGDIHTVMHLVEERFQTRLGVGLSKVTWGEPHSGSTQHSPDQVLALATFLPFRPDADHKVVNRAAGEHKFALGNVHALPEVYSRYASDMAFREQTDIVLRRHQRGDWGEIEQSDWEKNDSGLFEEFQPPIPSRLRIRDKLWSLYTILGEAVLVTTSADRTTTEVMFTREYV